MDCGGGNHTRTREIAVMAENGGDKCTGSATEIAICNAEDCPGM